MPRTAAKNLSYFQDDKLKLPQKYARVTPRA
jgi:hypothetical protein